MRAAQRANIYILYLHYTERAMGSYMEWLYGLKEDVVLAA